DRRGRADRPRRLRLDARARDGPARGGEPDDDGEGARDPPRARPWPPSAAHPGAGPARRGCRGRGARTRRQTRVADHALPRARRQRAAAIRLHADPDGARVARGWRRIRSDQRCCGGGVMAVAAEIARVRRVYHGYAERGRDEREWAADHPGNRAMGEERTRVLAALLERSGRLPLGARRVLDLGCGDGDVLAGLVRWGALPARLIG